MPGFLYTVKRVKKCLRVPISVRARGGGNSAPSATQRCRRTHRVRLGDLLVILWRLEVHAAGGKWGVLFADAVEHQLVHREDFEILKVPIRWQVVNIFEVGGSEHAVVELPQRVGKPLQ